MTQMPSPTRAQQLERLLRRLRQMCFENDKAERLIPTVKARLKPLWDQHAAAEDYAAGQRLLYLYA